MFVIPKALRPVADFCADEVTRYVLQNVQVSRDGSRLSACATDGKRIIDVSWEEKLYQSTWPAEQGEAHEALLVPKELWKRVDPPTREIENNTFAVRLFKGDTTRHGAGGVVSVAWADKLLTELDVRVRTPEGHFPSKTEVLKQQIVSADEILISPDMLAKTFQTVVAIARAAGRRHQGITVRPFGRPEKASGLVIECNPGDFQIKAVLMGLSKVD
jgi:hypothetical protein